MSQNNRQDEEWNGRQPPPSLPPSRQSPSRQGISWEEAAVFVASEMAGGGVLALPKALTKTGWMGIPVIILAFVMAVFSCKRLSDCWTVLEVRNPDIRTKKTHPYVIIAEQIIGNTGSSLVSMGLVTMQFGISVVYLLLTAELVEQVLHSMAPTFKICTWYLIVVAFMTLLMYFNTPDEFQFLGMAITVSVVAGCFLYFIAMINEIRPYVYRYGTHNVKDVFISFGVIMFTFSGASSFPTLQSDMADRKQFNKGLYIGFFVILAMYLAIAIGGYAILGEIVSPNLPTSLADTPLTFVGNILMVIHFICTFIIIISPVCKGVEDMYDDIKDAKLHRSAVLFSIMLAILFAGATVPRFYTIMSLVGGSSVALLTYVLPCYCYIKLANSGPRPRDPVPNYTDILCFEVMVIGAAAGLVSSCCALGVMFGTTQAVPCYFR